MTRARAVDLAAAILAIAIAAGLVFALHTGPTAHGDSTPQRLTIPEPEEPAALFIGDSYTGASTLAEMSYACQAAVRMHWLCDLAAMPGTGYISGGQANRFHIEYLGDSTTFDERVHGLAKRAAPDIVVLDGGRNDKFAPIEDVYDAVRGTIEDIRAAWPAAKIVFVRPRFLQRPSDDCGFDDDFVARLKLDPATGELIVVDPLLSFDSMDTGALVGPDGMHPNADGNKRIAAALVDSLTTQGLAAAR
ncbi:SGNH/GDSL hydrolase family protein [Nocardia sp. ET3-3]|uniref:SGNH/GDSL hydrolase family protein n=1 Tax=Nocardia terrae TaxID=2675851 RepID=A0A7K1USJ2_9NOCA|nr:SGNH/GDSL hydrolase family protein [Nocardia terrae]MVU77316.1 SGNH/GDSL hydrolase family protein [Nocardia terrae]